MFTEDQTNAEAQASVKCASMRASLQAPFEFVQALFKILTF
jgi:hypothetical protein